MYPDYLLPKTNYHKISSAHFVQNNDLVLIRHIDSSEVIYMDGTGVLHPDCITFRSDQLRDLSTNLLGVFTYPDIYFVIRKESSEELYSLWEEGEEVREIKTDEFFKDEGRRAFYIPISKVLSFVTDEIRSHIWHLGLLHTPTKCNFWHVSIRVLDEDDNELGKMETIKDSGKKKIWKTIRDFMVTRIIDDKGIPYKQIPVQSYHY